MKQGTTPIESIQNLNNFYVGKAPLELYKMLQYGRFCRNHISVEK